MTDKSRPEKSASALGSWLRDQSQTKLTTLQVVTYLVITVAALWGTAMIWSSEPAKPVSKPVLKTTWAEVQTRFAENGVAAQGFYEAHSLALSARILRIMPGGGSSTIVLVDGRGETFGATFAHGQVDRIKTLKVGDAITFSCDTVVLGLSLDDCSLQ